MTFEELDQNSGFVLYETTLPKLTRDPSQLTINELRDRAQIYVDEVSMEFKRKRIIRSEYK